MSAVDHRDAGRGRRTAADDRGATLALFALVLVSLLVICSVVLDFGNAAQRKRQAQGASDNATVAAAYDLPASGTATTAAASYAAANLELADFGAGTPCGTNTTCFDAGGWELSVTTPYQGSDLQIHAELCRDIDTVFGQVIGADTWSVCASASARAAISPIPGPDILVLAPSGDQQLTCSGACAIFAGSVAVNSTGAKGLRVSGGGKVTADVIDVGSASANGVDQPPNVTCSGANFNTAGCPTLGTTTPDPYAAVVPPSQAEVQAAHPSPGCVPVSGVLTCSPGVYESTLTVSSTTAEFLPGIYYLKNGMTISGGSPASGTNVFFYNHSGKFTVSGGSGLDFTPLQNGAGYGSMLVMQARTNTEKMTFSGGSDVQVPGVLYNPMGETIYSGGSGTDTGVAQIVTNKLTVSGASYIGTIGGGGAAGAGDVELYE